MNKPELPESRAYAKAIKYYRRLTLGLIPVTILLERKVMKRAQKYYQEEIKRDALKNNEE